jgi:hypothetical protein
MHVLGICFLLITVQSADLGMAFDGTRTISAGVRKAYQS